MKVMEERLSFASYAKCLKVAMKSPYDKQLKLTELLLEFLIIPDAEDEGYNACDKKGEILVVDKTMASNLFNNKDNVHSSIQKNCDEDIVIDGIKGYFEEKVLPSISTHLMDDLLRNMREIVAVDTDISEVKKKELLERAEENDNSGFLSSVFLYAVKKENKMEKQARGDSVKNSDANDQYYNSFVENLFLHREEGSKTVRLKDLFVMPKYEEIQWNEKRNGDNTVNYISEFAAHIMEGDRRQGEILFIEGDAGVGKTSLVSYLAYLYIEEHKEWKQLFENKTLLCIRLRDIIPEQMKFSSDTIVKDILNYLGLKSMDEFKRIYKDVLIILDGFDELCMVEGINVNSDYYIYQIFKAFMDYKIVITTRPQYLDVTRLDIRKKHIVLQHFDVLQRIEWVDNYRQTGVLEYEEGGIEYILNEKNEEIKSICDTPMVMYMIVAGGINEDAKHNKWLLYHQIFYKELSDTEYNSMFFNCDGIYSHGIKKNQELLYRVSAEISYKMYCDCNAKLYLTEQEILEIVNDLDIEDIKLKEVVYHCYALCSYWKSNGKGAVEFYHNNIRDFFLCEKIFYEFNSIYQVCETLDIQKVITYINERIYDLFRYNVISSKVIDFLYLRAKYGYEHHNMMDFPFKEHKRKYLPYFFTDMLQYGGVSRYDRNSGENVYDNMINTLTNTVRIIRFVLEPYLAEEEYIIYFQCVDSINRARIFKYSFPFLFSRMLVGKFNKNILGNRADFKGVDLSGTNLFLGRLEETNLKNADLSYSNMRQIVFENCNLEQANLRKANLYQSVFKKCNLSGCILEMADLRESKLCEVDLKKANIKAVDLREAELCEVDLRGANMERTNLTAVDLSNTKIAGTQLNWSHLKDANLKGMELKNIDLEGADLKNANLSGADLRNANLSGADLRNAILPDGFMSSNQVIQLKHLSELQILGLIIDSSE